MAKKFFELHAAMSPAAQQQANKKTKAMLSEMPLRALSSHTEATGGELDIIARFPDGTVKISNFTELGSTT
jgi:Holliday junction resolvase-like predicted endonuclease